MSAIGSDTINNKIHFKRATWEVARVSETNYLKKDCGLKRKKRGENTRKEWRKCEHNEAWKTKVHKVDLPNPQMGLSDKDKLQMFLNILLNDKNVLLLYLDYLNTHSSSPPLPSRQGLRQFSSGACLGLWLGKVGENITFLQISATRLLGV